MATPEPIRRFSFVTWIFGTIAIAVISFLVLPQVSVNTDTGDVYVGDPDDAPDWPWLVDDPQEYEVVDGVLHGTREGGFLRLPANSDMLMITGAEGADEPDFVGVSQQLNDELDVESDDWLSPGFMGSLYADGDVLVLPGTADGLLWFDASLADWTATVTVVEPTPMHGTAEGTGNAVLLYEGEALSGRFRHTGSGLFIVSAVTVGDWNLLLNETDEVDLRVSWPSTDRVVFQIEADTGDGSWSIVLDTPAGETTAEPTPAPTTAPTP